jgi:molybdopterin-guanine dinucleotide biosynthesis protein A
MGSPDVGGYVLAGGKSSRMGQDKALLELAGRPLIEHAVAKLRRVCEDVHILSGRQELAAFAPLVRDLHEGCGPMGGLEAAFEHSQQEWNLMMPVDMPFLPSASLDAWVRGVIVDQERGARVAMFTVDGVPQPLFCLLHREVATSVRDAMQRGQYKVFPVLEGAAKELAVRQGISADQAFLNRPWEEIGELFVEPVGGEPRSVPMEAQQAARHLWFANLNTPEDFAMAEEHLDALDT